jgi:hypothetical protein
MIPAENSDDEADASMVTPKKTRLHRPTFGSIIVPFYLFGGLVSPRHSESAPRNNGSRYRFGMIKVETRTQLLMPTQVRTGDDGRETVGRRELVVERPAPGTEIIDEHEDEVAVSQPIPEGEMLNGVVIIAVSNDRGWSARPDDHGTHRSNS